MRLNPLAWFDGLECLGILPAETDEGQHAVGEQQNPER
jgi:hypothetical protein